MYVIASAVLYIMKLKVSVYVICTDMTMVSVGSVTGDQMVTVLLRSHMLLGGLSAFIFDNTLSGIWIIHCNRWNNIDSFLID